MTKRKLIDTLKPLKDAEDVVQKLEQPGIIIPPGQEKEILGLIIKLMTNRPQLFHDKNNEPLRQYCLQLCVDIDQQLLNLPGEPSPKKR